MFEWDSPKATNNVARGRIDFEDAARALLGLCLNEASPRGTESRTKTTGEVDGHVIVVVWTPRDNALRLISARSANRSERQRYHKAIRKRAPPR